ncbi:MAG: glycosyl hydrolase family 28 protein [Acidobacteriaceae bacterium]|nr:glycosyl hydrolase family 28 protein [Acidobacteriaceae bacterium]
MFPDAIARTSGRWMGALRADAMVAGVLAALAMGVGAARIWAQDTRTVTEPVIPPGCARLEAKIVAVGEGLAEVDESRSDTARIQAAIDHCAAGKAVELALGRASGKNSVKNASGKKAMVQPTTNAFLSGPLELREGVTLLVDKGVTLFASRRASDYDVTPGACGVLMKARAQACKSFLTIRARNTGIMGEGVIDGRGGAKLLDKGYSWWALAVKAEPGNVPYGDPRLIDAAQADGFTLYKISLHNSPNFHVGVSQTNGFTVWGVHLKTPTVEPGPNDPRPRNTDGIDPGLSTNITIAHSWIDNGDDNIAIKSGVTHMSVLDNHFYSGHGMSIGSGTFEGDSFLLVDGLVEDHTTSGIRIKSNATRGGLVHDLTYRNVCMRDVQVPIAISPYYNDNTIEPFVDPGIKGDRIPDYKKITLQNIYDETPGDVLIAGYDEAHRTEITLSNVFIEGIQPEKMHLKFTAIEDDGTNLPLTAASTGNAGNVVRVLPGSGSNQQTGSSSQALFSCDGRFSPMQ